MGRKRVDVGADIMSERAHLKQHLWSAKIRVSNCYNSHAGGSRTVDENYFSRKT